MITTSPTDDGYIFYNKGAVVAIGNYGGGEFTLLETDNSTTTHPNGMVAMSLLRSKYTPDFYLQPVSPKHDIVFTNIKKYSKHPALININKDTFLAISK